MKNISEQKYELFPLESSNVEYRSNDNTNAKKSVYYQEYISAHDRHILVFKADTIVRAHPRQSLVSQ